MCMHLGVCIYLPIYNEFITAGGLHTTAEAYTPLQRYALHFYTEVQRCMYLCPSLCVYEGIKV